MPTSPVRLAQGLLLTLSILWLPGQSRASVARVVFVSGLLPLALLLGGRWPRERRLLPWLALSLLCAGLAPWVLAPGAALSVALTWLGLTASLALGIGVSAAGGLAALSPAACAAGALSALTGLWVLGGTFLNSAYQAGFLVMTTLLTLPELGRTRRRAALAVGSLALQGAALWRSDSYGAYTALAVGLALAQSHGPRWRRVLPSLALLGGLALTFTTEGATAHLKSRSHMFQVSGAVAWDALPAGVGPGQLQGPFLQAQAKLAPTPLWTHARHAHNEALQVLAELGLPGLLLLVLPFLGGLKPASPERRQALSVAVAFGILSAVAPAAHEPAEGFLGALALGGLLKTSDAPLKGWGRALLVPIAIAGLALSALDLVADRLLVRGVNESDLALLRAAATLSLEPDRAERQLALLVMPEDPQEAERLAREVATRRPSVEALLLLGQAAMTREAPEAAIPAYLEAARLHPQLFAAHFNLARAYEEVGDRPAARRHAARARSLRPSDLRLVWLPR